MNADRQWREWFRGERHREAYARAHAQWNVIKARGIPESYGDVPLDAQARYRLGGKAAEMLVSRVLNLPMAEDLEQDVRDGDVPPYGVRHTGRGWRLLVTPTDPPGRVIISVRGEYPILEAKGWAWAHEAQHPRYYMCLDGTGRKNYFLDCVHPMAELPPPDRSR